MKVYPLLFICFFMNAYAGLQQKQSRELSEWLSKYTGLLKVLLESDDGKKRVNKFQNDNHFSPLVERLEKESYEINEFVRRYNKNPGSFNKKCFDDFLRAVKERYISYFEPIYKDVKCQNKTR